MTSQDLLEIFKLGVDYGQLLMEEERDSEDLADAFQGHIVDSIYSMPSQQAPRRQPHSDAWRKAKIESKNKALAIIGLQMTKERNSQLKLSL